jgi:hypothetical protein
MLQTFVAENLRNLPHLINPLFQQNGATARTACLSMEAVQQFIGDKAISRFSNIHWPLRSSDLLV